MFALLDPDPDSESGSTDLIESGSETQKEATVPDKRALQGAPGWDPVEWTPAGREHTPARDPLAKGDAPDVNRRPSPPRHNAGTHHARYERPGVCHHHSSAQVA
jgi:hypothetical protein